MDAKEQALIAISRVPANSGHSLHKGTPREAFIKEFLIGHLPETVAIGTGEIIDASSQPNESRNQYDIVIYNKSYPKLDFGGGVSGFLAESVIATVEVKSTLTKDGLAQAIRAARNAKALEPHFVTSFSAGYVPPKILNYIVAYDGPSKMDTAQAWLHEVHAGLGLVTPNLPQGDARLRQASPSLDGMPILGKGFSYFDNVPTGFSTPESHAAQPEVKWIYASSESGNLLMLFLLLQSATANISGRWLDAIPYLSNFRVTGLLASTAS
jgi:hypothetical protein